VSADESTGVGAAEDPLRLAVEKSKQARARRFYETVSVVEGAGTFEIRLDGRSVRTPARAVLSVPSRALAEALAAEWDAQKSEIDPILMPLTRLLNSAVDGVSETMAETRAAVLKFAETDLLCYRASHPQELVALQMAQWDPVIGVIQARYGHRPVLVEGVLHAAQPAALLEAMAQDLQAADALALAALYTASALMGSAFLGVAVWSGRLDAEAAWRAAHVDEDFQISQWGEDAEATARRVARKRDFDAAMLVLKERA